MRKLVRWAATLAPVLALGLASTGPAFAKEAKKEEKKAAAKKDDKKADKKDDKKAAGPAWTAKDKDLTQKPEVRIPDGAAPKDLKKDDIVVGTGDEAVAGKSVEVHYVGVAWSDKKQFDASWDRGQTFNFKLGAGMVIKGWDEGVAGMKVGGRRQLTIPPEKGYGARGAGGAIKPNETLVFIVDLKAVK